MTDEYLAPAQPVQSTQSNGLRKILNATDTHIDALDRLLTEDLKEGIWAWDIPHDRFYLSQSVYELLGIPPGDDTALTLEAFEALIHPDDREQFEQMIKACLHQGGTFAIPLKIRHFLGSYRYVVLGGKLYLTPNASPMRASGHITDMTVLVQSDLPLKQAYQELSNIKRALDESTIVAVTDLNGVITYVNKEFCRISKYSAEELLGRTHRLINSGYHSQAFFAQLWQTIQQGHIWRGELKNKAKDGSYYWVKTTIVPLLDTEQKPMQYIAIRYDITPQKEAEEKISQFNLELIQRVEEQTNELKAINEQLQEGIEERKKIELKLREQLAQEQLSKRILQLMNHSFDTMVILEIAAQQIGRFYKVDRCLLINYVIADHQFTHLKLAAQYCSSDDVPTVQEEDIPWTAITYLRNTQDLDHPLVMMNFSRPEDFPESIRAYYTKYKVRSALVFEIRYRNISFGRLSLHQCKASRSWTVQEITFLETLIFYIASALYQAQLYEHEKKAQQDILEINRQKMKVLSYVSHDFKNPLASILRFIEILEKDEEGSLSAKQRKIIRYIAEGVQLLRNMVSNILDKARLEEGKMHPSMAAIDVENFLLRLKPMFNVLAAEKNVEILYEVQADLTTLQSDPLHLQQILINLLSNALKYNKVNGKVFIRFYKVPDQRFFVIEVEDTGIGISSDALQKLFQEYYRADLSGASLTEGSGLGLPFVKKLVELHEGNIEVESELDKGSIFRITLPLSIPTPTPTPTPTSVEQDH